MAAATKEASSDRDAMNTTANDNNNTTTSGGATTTSTTTYPTSAKDYDITDEWSRGVWGRVESNDTVEVERNGRDQSVGFRRSRPKLSGRNPTRSTNDEHAVASKLGEIPLLVHRRIELVGRDACARQSRC